MIEHHQPLAHRPGCCFVVDGAPTERLPLRELVDPKQKSPAGSNRPSRRLRVRESGSLRLPRRGVPLGHLRPVAGLDPDASSWARGAACDPRSSPTWDQHRRPARTTASITALARRLQAPNAQIWRHPRRRNRLRGCPGPDTRMSSVPLPARFSLGADRLVHVTGGERRSRLVYGRRRGERSVVVRRRHVAHRVLGQGGDREAWVDARIGG